MSPFNHKKERFLVTSALPYANGDIHLGHLLEVVQTDIFVRFKKLTGNEVLYICADDTHGTPIELSALRQGITPEQLIDKAHRNHTRDYAGFNIGFDTFYTTNSEENRHYAELIFESLKSQNLIIEKEIRQYFCEHDKRFLPDRFITGACPKCKTEGQYGDVCESCGATYEPTDLANPKCIICGSVPVLRSSRHFYVELAKREAFLREFLARTGVLQEDMGNFVGSWVNDGLREWCISRDGPYFGFKIPGTDNKFFYVWLDAPIGYISSTEHWCKLNDKSVNDYWSPESGCKVIHFIGKDIVYFHALFWPVMLDSAKFNLPTKIFVHGFLTVQGEKMSKTRGTFILARDYLDKVKHPQATEFLRFYFGSKLGPTASDIDLAKEELISKVNTTLANNIGNLHHRTFVFCERYFDGMIPDASWDEGIETQVNDAAKEIAACYEKAEFKLVVEKIHALGNLGNRYYQDTKPWESIKGDGTVAATAMVTCVNLIKALLVFLKPITPELSGKLETQLETTFEWDDYRFSLRNHKTGPVDKLVKPLEPEDFADLFVIDKPKSESIPDSDLIDLEIFKKSDLRVVTIVKAEKIEKAAKLLKLQVECDGTTRQVIAGIAASYSPESLIGKQVVLLANLKPAKLFGLQSQGMILAAADESGELTLITPQKAVASGAKVS